MLRGSNRIVLGIWLLLALLNISFAFFYSDMNLAKQYTAHLSDFAALGAAFFCYITAFGFDKGHPMRKVWMLLATGMLFWAGGAIYDSFYVFVNHVDEAPYPSYPDIGYLGMAICFTVALLLFKKEVDLESPLWGKTIAGVMFVAAMIFSYLTDCFTEEGVAFLVSSSYAVLDALLLTLVLLLVTSLQRGRFARAWWFMAVGIFLYLCADTGHTYLAYKETVIGRPLINAFWVIGFGCITLAAMMTYNMFHSSDT